MSAAWVVLTVLLGAGVGRAKTFQNSYVSFDVPDDWTCVQEGVAWTCTPQNPVAGKEAIIVLAAKVAGPEDSLNGFLNYLKQPKKISTKMGKLLTSQLMYAQPRMLATHNWIQAQHLSSEIEDYYTLYLATVKNQLAILISFSSEKNRIAYYNPIFDKAIKTLRIVASNELLFPKNQVSNSSDVIGIQVPTSPMAVENMSPPPERRPTPVKVLLSFIIIMLAALGGAYYLYIFKTRRKKISHIKIGKNRSK